MKKMTRTKMMTITASITKRNTAAANKKFPRTKNKNPRGYLRLYQMRQTIKSGKALSLSRF
ncbi:hypothetical protein ASG16_013695 [Brevibacillus sp. Leaf182]|nr:hypothetical protein ASG16_013695 [Brevibacillus sp. Leaf182]